MPAASLSKGVHVHVTLFETSIYVRPRFPVEFVIDVDGTAIRADIEWKDVEGLVGVAATDHESIRRFLHRHRTELGIAIQARLAARGVPFGRQLTLSAEDLRPLVVSQCVAADPEADARRGIDAATRCAREATGSPACIDPTGHA